MTEKRSIRLNETTHGDQLIQVDPVEVDEDRPRTDPQWQWDLKKWKN